LGFTGETRLEPSFWVGFRDQAQVSHSCKHNPTANEIVSFKLHAHDFDIEKVSDNDLKIQNHDDPAGFEAVIHLDVDNKADHV
jgi:hypothetical protein